MTKQHKPNKRKNLKKNKQSKITEYKNILMQSGNNYLSIEFWCNSQFYDKLEKFSDTQKRLHCSKNSL